LASVRARSAPRRLGEHFKRCARHDRRDQGDTRREPVGIGIKLAALPVDPSGMNEDELLDTIFNVNEDIARLTGTDFAAIATSDGDLNSTDGSRG
jgi:hypothetical protein